VASHTNTARTTTHNRQPERTPQSDRAYAVTQIWKETVAKSSQGSGGAADADTPRVTAASLAPNRELKRECQGRMILIGVLRVQ